MRLNLSPILIGLAGVGIFYYYYYEEGR
jgi:hypothetical protein